LAHPENGVAWEPGPAWRIHVWPSARISLALTTLGFYGHPLWWELATLVTIMLLGHWIEMSSIFQAQGALKELAKLLPDTALRLKNGDETEEVPVDQLGDGDLILIRPGASVPADGVSGAARAWSTRP
jgi:cation transport ATPase